MGLRVRLRIHCAVWWLRFVCAASGTEAFTQSEKSRVLILRYAFVVLHSAVLPYRHPLSLRQQLEEPENCMPEDPCELGPITTAS